MSEKSDVVELVCNDQRASELLGGISIRTVHKFVSDGKIRAVKIGARKLFVIESIQDFVRRAIREGTEKDAA